MASVHPAAVVRSPPWAHRYEAALSAASSMLNGSAVPSPFPSRPASCHVEGMNCMGPTAWSHRASPSRAPASESGIAAKPSPLRLGPTIGPLAWPVAVRLPPPYVPWPDSTKPTAATVFQPIPHVGADLLAAAAAAT